MRLPDRDGFHGGGSDLVGARRRRAHGSGLRLDLDHRDLLQMLLFAGRLALDTFVPVSADHDCADTHCRTFCHDHSPFTKLRLHQKSIVSACAANEGIDREKLPVSDRELPGPRIGRQRAKPVPLDLPLKQQKFRHRRAT